jgi:uncharacterized membrane protein
MYHALVFIHVLSAIVAVGCNLTYVVWLTRGDMAREHLLFALKGVKFIDDRIANPAYGLLLLTGIAQVVISHRPWNEPWIEWALGLYAILLVVAIGFYSPALARELAIVGERGPDDPGYRAAEQRQRIVGTVLVLIVLAIVALMVFRPGGS